MSLIKKKKKMGESKVVGTQQLIGVRVGPLTTTLMAILKRALKLCKREFRRILRAASWASRASHALSER